MSTENKEFFDLLNSIATEQSFSLQLSPRVSEDITVSCKPLSTAQLKKLVESVVDSPITQSSFNSTATKIFKDSLINVPPFSLNVVDRLLFILETRIQSLSPTLNVKDGERTVTVDVRQVKSKLEQQLKENADLLSSLAATENKVSITFGVALLDTEAQLNEELYKNIKVDVQDLDELRKIIGDSFINEIAKSIATITIGEKTLELSKGTFKSRLKAVESLPASLIQNVIDYIEKYRRLINDCLMVDGVTIPIDGSLFSLL